MRDDDLDFTIATLGECHVPSPVSGVRFTDDDERVLYHSTLGGIDAHLATGARPPAMESAGPRRMLFFDPAKLACGIVTCGGLCPGLNDVIRSIVLSLHHHAHWRVSPAYVTIEKDVDVTDPIPMLRLRMPGPTARVTLTWKAD